MVNLHIAYFCNVAFRDGYMEGVINFVIYVYFNFVFYTLPLEMA